MYHDGQLFESTGLYGRSSLRRVRLSTGEVLDRVDLPPGEFGEGLARVEGRLVQLTWRSGLAHVYDLSTFEAERSHRYSTEGWGLCFDGSRLVMSDGSDRLFFRDPTTFALRSQVSVRAGGSPVSQLNELECVGDRVYANVWQTNRIVVIDPESGQVVAEVDASGLLTASEQARADVLNGIAFVPETGRFLVTGKLWPKIFEVELAGASPARGGCSLVAPSRGAGAGAAATAAALCWLLARLRRRGTCGT